MTPHAYDRRLLKFEHIFSDACRLCQRPVGTPPATQLACRTAGDVEKQSPRNHTHNSSATPLCRPPRRAGPQPQHYGKCLHKTCRVPIMLGIRVVHNVAQFWVLAIVKVWRGDVIGHGPQATVPGIHKQGKTARQRTRQTNPTTARTISKIH